MKMPSERVRAYIYAVLTAAVPLLIGYGILTAEQAALWLGLAAAALGLGLATANTSTKPNQRGAGEVGLIVGVLLVVILVVVLLRLL